MFCLLFFASVSNTLLCHCFLFTSRQMRIRFGNLRKAAETSVGVAKRTRHKTSRTSCQAFTLRHCTTREFGIGPKEPIDPEMEPRRLCLSGLREKMMSGLRSWTVSVNSGEEIVLSIIQLHSLTMLVLNPLTFQTTKEISRRLFSSLPNLVF